MAVVAAANRIPLGIVKAITDSADRKGVKDFKRNVREGCALIQRVVISLLEP